MPADRLVEVERDVTAKAVNGVVPVTVELLMSIIGEMRTLRYDKARLDWLIPRYCVGCFDDDGEWHEVPGRAEIDAMMDSEPASRKPPSDK